MAKDSQLTAVRKTLELEEHKALQHYSEIDRVVRERRESLDVTKARQQALKKKLLDLAQKHRMNALQGGEVAQLAGIDRYAGRLRKELAEVDELVASKQQELDRALERAKLADEDLVKARLERKRIERFIDERSLQEKVLGAAVEEALLDEMSSFRRGDK